MLKRIIHLIPLLAGLAVAGIVFVGYRTDQENYGHKLRTEAVQALTSVKGQLELEFASSRHLVNALEAALRMNPDMSRTQFGLLARTLLIDRPAVRSVQLLRNDAVSHRYPEGNWRRGGPGVASLPPSFHALVARARETGRMQVLSPDPRYPGRSDVVILSPVFLSGADDSVLFWGMIEVILDAGTFYRSALFSRFGPDMLLALQRPEGPSERGVLLAGDPMVFDMMPLVENIDVFGEQLQLAAAPGKGWGPSPYGTYILLFGALAVLLLPAALWAVAVMILGLLRDRERYYQLIHNAKSIILRIDMSGEIDFCNEYAEEFYGYDPGELLGKPLVGTLVPRRSVGGEPMRRYLTRLLKDPAAHPFNETPNLRKNGETVWVAWANDAVLARGGNMAGVLCVGTDITDRKLMEEALRQREKQYRLLAENVTDIIWGLDADYLFTYVSPSDEALRGFKRHEVLGRSIFDSLTPRSRDRFKGALAMLEDETRQGYAHASVIEDLEFACADGTTTWLESRLGVLLNEEGERIGLQGVSRDISDRKLAEALRDDMERMARHDLKTPLGAVVGLPEEIRRLGGLTASQGVMLDTIEKAGNNMLQLINHSLDLYKMECGTYVLNKTTVDVLRLLEDIKAEVLPQIREKGISVGIEAWDGLLVDAFPLLVDEELFRSMLANLIRNALEASPESGSLTILLEKGDTVTIRIRNQGEVPRTVWETFFEKYSTSNPARGSGLGTYSARLIARTHGGDISVQTGTGETCVVVTLPRSVTAS